METKDHDWFSLVFFFPVSLATVACSSLIVYTVRTNSDTLKYTGQKSNVDLQSTSRPTVTQGTMRTTALSEINTMSSKLTMWEQRWQIVEFVNWTMVPSIRDMSENMEGVRSNLCRITSKGGILQQRLIITYLARLMKCICTKNMNFWRWKHLFQLEINTCTINFSHLWRYNTKHLAIYILFFP